MVRRARHPRLHDARLRDLEHTKSNACALMNALGAPSRRSTSGPPRPDARPRSAIRSPTASRCTTSRSRTCRPVCAPIICSASPTSTAGSSSAPATCRSSRSAGRTYGVGDQMSHYEVNAGIPKTLIQYLIRWVIADRRASSSDQRATCCSRSSTPRSAPSWCPPSQDGAMQSTEDRVGPYELHDFALYYILRFGLPPSKVAFLAWHAWRDADAGPGRPDSPTKTLRVRPADGAQVAAGVPAALLRVRQFKRSAIPNGPKVSPGGGAVAARRLARAVGRERRGLARRIGCRAPRSRTVDDTSEVLVVRDTRRHRPRNSIQP